MIPGQDPLSLNFQKLAVLYQYLIIIDGELTQLGHIFKGSYIKCRHSTRADIFIRETAASGHALYRYTEKACKARFVSAPLIPNNEA